MTVTLDSWLNSEFGEVVRRQRRQAGLTQEHLATAAELSRTSVVNIERGRQGVSLPTLYRLAAALSCEPSALLPAASLDAEPLIAHGGDTESARLAVRRIAARAQTLP